MKFKFSAHLRMVFALALVAGFVGPAFALSTGTASAAARDIPNCMGKDMGCWARDGSSTALGTGWVDFDSGSGWGHHVARSAQDPATNWGQEMVKHLAGDFYGYPGISCAP